MRKQSIFLFILLTITLLGVAACGDKSSAETQPELANFITETNAEMGLTYTYPEGWITHNALGGLTIASNQRVIDSSSMADMGEDGFVLIIPGEIDVLNFQADQSISEDKPFPALFIYQQLLEKAGQDHLGVEPPQELALDGQTGAITLTRATIEEEEIMTFLAVIMNDGQIALISAGARADSFDGLRPLFEQIIRSIEITVPAGLNE